MSILRGEGAEKSTGRSRVVIPVREDLGFESSLLRQR